MGSLFPFVKVLSWNTQPGSESEAILVEAGLVTDCMSLPPSWPEIPVNADQGAYRVGKIEYSEIPAEGTAAALQFHGW